MSISLHDTHFHLDLFERPKEILAQIEEEKIYTIAVTNLPDIFQHTQQLVQGYKYIKAALGFHPELAHKYSNQLVRFIELLPLARYVGEVGLDNFNKTSVDYQAQKKIFEEIITACSATPKKILTVHSRRAERDVIAIIGANFRGKIILHWYSGGIKEINTALSYGFYFSVNYAMTQSEFGKKIIGRIPVDRILLETDGPFVKVRNQPSTPLVTKLILNEIILLKQQPDMLRILNDNLRAVLS
ncbi:MAG: TatD family hydrolase [Chitinophagaceae bacterium]|nr:TatD family hydrolase [Chitinophagaceae bacterium]